MLQEKTARKKQALHIGILSRARKSFFSNKGFRVLLLANGKDD